MAWKGFKDVRATIEINLNKSEEELWNSVDKKARWGVKKAEKEGLIVDELKEEKELHELYEIYRETCRYGGINPFSVEELKKSNPVFFLCKFNEKIIAGAAIIKNDDKITLYINCSLHEYLESQPNNLLYWHIIKWGKAKNFHVFDLGGYQLNAKEGDKLHHVNRFKERWGGEIKKYYIYSYNPFYVLGRKLIRNSRFFKWLWDRIKRRPRFIKK